MLNFSSAIYRFLLICIFTTIRGKEAKIQPSGSRLWNKIEFDSSRRPVNRKPSDQLYLSISIKQSLPKTFRKTDPFQSFYRLWIKKSKIEKKEKIDSTKWGKIGGAFWRWAIACQIIG